jgi:hypothetical protein
MTAGLAFLHTPFSTPTGAVMPRKAPLRVVEAGEKREPLSLLDAVSAGDYLAELVALHRRIAVSVNNPETPARDLASLTRRQLEISKEIKALRAASEGDEVGAAASTPDEEWAVT